MNKPVYNDNIYHAKAQYGVLENTGVIIAENGIITTCNTIAEKLLHTSQNKLIGCHITSICQQFCDAEISQVLENNNIEPFTFSCNLNNNSPSKLYASIIVKTLTVNNKLYKHIAITPENPTTDLYKQLKTAFLRNISHELRTPLNSIMGFTQIMKYRSINDEVKTKYLDVIEKKSSDFLDTVNKMIELAELEIGEISLIVHSFSLFGFLEQLETSFNNLTVLRTHPDLTIHSDSNVLLKSLKYITENAFKYSNNNQVIVSTTVYKNEIKIGITDNGVGIPNEKMQLIFDSFEKADNSDTAKTEGLGLGLSIADKLVKKLGGHIKVESKLGKGSSFFICIPVVYNNPLRTINHI